MDETTDQKEFLELLGINPARAYGLRISRVLTVTNDFVVQTAVLIALGYLVESFFDERIEDQVITGSFNDFFKAKSDKKQKKPNHTEDPLFFMSFP